MKNQIVLFGAGQIGRMALNEYKDKVAFFLDNNQALKGKSIQGVDIRLPNDVKDSLINYRIIISSKHQEVMEQQLIELGIENYEFYESGMQRYYPTDELIYNPYTFENEGEWTENGWNEKTRLNLARQTVNKRVEELYGKHTLFDHVEIETVNRCNGGCAFCPVSKGNDIREYHEMPEWLFRDIIDQLGTMDYSGKLALFSNNEPLLDPKILERHKYARTHVPNARMHLFTNGTLLTVEKFAELVKYLDELIIDNYQQNLRLIQPCQDIAKYCEKYPDLKKKVTIVLRKPQEILTTRGGDAPNRKNKVSYGEDRCELPFKQLIIRPDGKVSLCCNDPWGQNTLGDLTKNTLLEVWNNDRFNIVRKCLYEGRKNWKHCEYCDVFSLS